MGSEGCPRHRPPGSYTTPREDSVRLLAYGQLQIVMDDAKHTWLLCFERHGLS
jgi:hypothetical protein